MGMLNIRVEGDLDEALAFLERQGAIGVEVQLSTTKDRGTFAHQYALVRMVDWQPATPPAGPVRVSATVGRPVGGGRAIEGGRSRRRRG
jgi:hypothetical protein